jgi:Uma2 family endonuclease
MEEETVRPMPETRVKFTIEDYELFPDDGQRHELVDGEHVVTPAPTARHQRILGRLFIAFHQASGGSESGEVFFAPIDVVLSFTDVVQPDLLFVRKERAGIIDRRVEGPPDLAIEVVSPSSRRTDELLKRRAYERYGVEELWIVDPELERIRIYRREGQGEGFARPIELATEHGDVAETPLLPDLRLDLASLFA